MWTRELERERQRDRKRKKERESEREWETTKLSSRAKKRSLLPNPTNRSLMSYSASVDTTSQKSASQWQEPASHDVTRRDVARRHASASGHRPQWPKTNASNVSLWNATVSSSVLELWLDRRSAPKQCGSVTVLQSRPPDSWLWLEKKTGLEEASWRPLEAAQSSFEASLKG